MHTLLDTALAFDRDHARHDQRVQRASLRDLLRLR